jgi:hypothetical protein
MRLPATISLAADQANLDRETPPVAAARLDDPPRMHGRKGARILAESLSEPGMPLAHALRQEHFDRAPIVSIWGQPNMVSAAGFKPAILASFPRAIMPSGQIFAMKLSESILWPVASIPAELSAAR